MASKKSKENQRILSADLRKLDINELKKKLAEEKEKLMRLRFDHAAATLENTSLLKITRRQIARIETVITEKSIEPRI